MTYQHLLKEEPCVCLEGFLQGLKFDSKEFTCTVLTKKLENDFDLTQTLYDDIMQMHSKEAPQGDKTMRGQKRKINYKYST